MPEEKLEQQAHDLAVAYLTTHSQASNQGEFFEEYLSLKRFFKSQLLYQK